jgi:glutathione S-transferase
MTQLINELHRLRSEPTVRTGSSPLHRILKGPSVKLYNHSHAPNPRRVRVFLAEKGIEVGLEEIDILAGQSRTPEFLAKNSSGGVPLLELDDGSYLSESVAICRYLEGLHPEPNLLGRDLREQAEIERWNRRMELELIGCDRAHFSKYQSDLSRTFQAIPGIRRSAASGGLSASRADGSRVGRTSIRCRRPFHDCRHHGVGRNRLGRSFC